MSDTQAKAAPSNAARKLAYDLGFGSIDKSPDAVTRAEEIIQSALSELLEKSQTFKTCEYGGKGCAAYDKPLCRTCAIQKALEPWKPQE